MLKIRAFFLNRGPVSVILSVVLAVLFVVTAVNAATTISTNINTGGTLTVTGVGHLQSALNVYGTSFNLGTGSATTTLTALSATLLSLNGDLDIYGADLNLGTGSATSTLTSAAGLLGLGSTTPAARFSIQQGAAGTRGFYIAGYSNATEDMLRISTSTAAATTTAFVVNNDGQVGIGTSTPAARGLSVVGSGLFGTNNATTSLIVDSTRASTGGCIQLRATDGTWVRIYATTSPIAVTSPWNLVVQPGACQ